MDSDAVQKKCISEPCDDNAAWPVRNHTCLSVCFHWISGGLPSGGKCDDSNGDSRCAVRGTVCLGDGMQ